METKASAFPNLGISGVDFVEFWCGNALTSSTFFCKYFGFVEIATRVVELPKKRISRLCVQTNVKYIFTSSIDSSDDEFYKYLAKHGDSVVDIAFNTTNVSEKYTKAIKNGAISVEEPKEYTTKDGKTILAKIKFPIGDLNHTLIDRSANKNDASMPDFIEKETKRSKKDFGFTSVDHIALAVPEGKVIESLQYYCTALGFHQFFEDDFNTKDGMVTVVGRAGGLKNAVGAIDGPSHFKIVFVEPVEIISTPSTKNRKTQVQEFLDFNNGSGVQHIALHTNDIIKSVRTIKEKGLELIKVPATYYDTIFESEGMFMKQHRNDLQELGILLEVSKAPTSKENSEDLYEHPNPQIAHFMLQTFTAPLSDRPTFFMEIISRKGSSGFGQRTIKALFEAVEKLQQQGIL